MSVESKRKATRAWVKRNLERVYEYNRANYRLKRYGDFSLMKIYIEKYRRKS